VSDTSWYNDTLNSIFRQADQLRRNGAFKAKKGQTPGTYNMPEDMAVPGSATAIKTQKAPPPGAVNYSPSTGLYYDANNHPIEVK
jgi:hypothetical protein